MWDILGIVALVAAVGGLVWAAGRLFGGAGGSDDLGDSVDEPDAWYPREGEAAAAGGTD